MVDTVAARALYASTAEVQSLWYRAPEIIVGVTPWGTQIVRACGYGLCIAQQWCLWVHGCGYGLCIALQWCPWVSGQCRLIE